MKILHICPTYFPANGGAETHAMRISKGLAARGHEVTVLTVNVSGSQFLWTAQSGGLPKEEIIDRVRVQRLEPDGGIAGSLWRAWQQLPGGYRALTKAFGRDGVEMITRKPYLPGLIPRLLVTQAEIISTINWFWPVAYYAYLARRMRKFTLVGIPLLHVEEPWCSTSLHKRMLASCDAVITNTSYEADYVRQQADVRTEPIGVGIEPSEFVGRNGYNPPALYQLDRLPVVGYVGRLHPNKGVATLIRAMSLVWRSRPEVRLVLAGPRSTLDKEVVSVVQSLSEAERGRIVWIYDFPESHKPAIYDAFDVFAMPSKAESFGITYLEAWICGKPVIGARTDQTQCVIDHGVDGLLVGFGDPRETAAALLELLSNPQKCGEMAQHGRAKTEAYFTWDKVTDKVERVYAGLVADKQHP
ncbi:MAG: glycosyltransferase family 4 protein [Candidatus Acidiferrales bacterium]